MKTKPKRKKKKSNFGKYGTVALGLFLISIMVLSVINPGEKEGEIEYNGYKFVEVQGGWQTYKNNNLVFIVNDPSELEDIPVDDIYFGAVEKIYLSYKDYIPGNFQLIPLPVRPILSTYDEDFSIEQNIPVKTCSDASMGIIVIMIQEGDPAAKFDQNCLLLYGDEQELVKVVDKIVLNMHGI